MSSENITLENLDEKYFSDILKLLLTTKGIEKGLRTQFANEFVKEVYGEGKPYALSNSSVIREYPLNISRKRTRNIDLLFFDLDERDDFIIGIENKFLTEDKENQLNEYYDALKKLFPNKPVKLVYLTLDGRAPKYYISNDLRCNLICMSWLETIPILINNSKVHIQHNLNNNIQKLQSILEEIKKIDKKNINYTLNNTKILAQSICQMLQSNDQKGWEFDDKNDQNSYTIYKKYKTIDKKTKIKINIAFYGHYYAIYYFANAKLFIPINIDIDQGKHLVEILCKNIIGKEDIVLQTDIDLSNVFKINKDDQVLMYKSAIKKYLETVKEHYTKCKAKQITFSKDNITYKADIKYSIDKRLPRNFTVNLIEPQIIKDFTSHEYSGWITGLGLKDKVFVLEESEINLDKEKEFNIFHDVVEQIITEYKRLINE